MRTGLLAEDREMDEGFYNSLQALLCVLGSDVADTAVTLAEHGKRQVAMQDMRVALRHQAQCFFEQADLEGKVQAARTELEAMDSDSSGEDDDVEYELEEGEIPPLSQCDCALCSEALKTDRDWPRWHPEDEVLAFLKAHVDRMFPAE